MLLHSFATIMFCGHYFRSLPTTRRLLTQVVRSSSSANQLLTMNLSLSPEPNNTAMHDASTLFLQRQSDLKKNVYTLSDIIIYLDQIQEILESSKPSPAMKYDHCYQSENSTTFFKVVSNVLAKPMLRTLIYHNSHTIGRKKIHFDQRIREEKAALEFDRMYAFVINTLRPAAMKLDEDLRSTFIPQLLQQVDTIEQRVQDEGLASKLLGWNGLFHRLASGRYYKGKLDAMVNDLFPQHAEEFHAASRKVTEREVLERIIQLDLVNESTNIELSKDEEAWIERRINAAKTCLDIFYSTSDDDIEHISNQDHLEGIKSGKRCEQSCLDFLKDVYINDDNTAHKILSNVYVNNRRKPFAEQTQKYIPPKTLRRGAPQKQKELGIIWTDCTSGIMSNRHRECSEFDAVIVRHANESEDQVQIMDDSNTNYTTIESIFEAKRTISPSTLHDILMKKLGAIESLLEDTSAELAYKYSDGTSGTAPISSDTTPNFTFGIYGVELLPPGNAADSIRSIAGSNIVSSNIQEVVCALERGSQREDSAVMVEVEVESTIEIVENLKTIIEEKKQNDKIEIVFVLEEEACFLR